MSMGGSYVINEAGEKVLVHRTDHVIEAPPAQIEATPAQPDVPAAPRKPTKAAPAAPEATTDNPQKE